MWKGHLASLRACWTGSWGDSLVWKSHTLWPNTLTLIPCTVLPAAGDALLCGTQIGVRGRRQQASCLSPKET